MHVSQWIVCDTPGSRHAEPRDRRGRYATRVSNQCRRTYVCDPSSGFGIGLNFASAPEGQSDGAPLPRLIDTESLCGVLYLRGLGVRRDVTGGSCQSCGMRVHHLNCGTMTPLIVGRIVCHVLLCESNDGLVLVDTGFGLADCADHSRIGPARLLLNARFSDAETAARQVEALGYARSDVRHIVVTHFDLDHVGGRAISRTPRCIRRRSSSR